MDAVAAVPQSTSQPARKREPVATDVHLGNSEYKRQEFVLDVPEGHTPDDIVQPSYWAHVAYRIERFARIEARVETGEWIAELLVVQCGRNWASVKMLALHDLTDKQEPQHEAAARKHIVKWRGGIRKWAIVRISDNEVISEGHASQRVAEDALSQYENMLATT